MLAWSRGLCVQRPFGEDPTVWLQRRKGEKVGANIFGNKLRVGANVYDDVNKNQCQWSEKNRVGQDVV